MYNEEDVLPILIARLRPIMDTLDEPYEVIAVDDGSADRTAPLLMAARRTWPQLRVIRLRRNSGHQAALTAGLHRSHGSFVASLDADLQDPPEKIMEMLALAQAESLDIVYGVRDDRDTDTVFKRNTARLYYSLMRRIVGKKIPDNAGDFRLLSRDAVEALKALPERQPVYRLLVPWLGFPSGTVTYRRETRAAGVTKYPLGKMIRLALDSVTNFSAAPLRISTWLGGFGFVVCLGLIVYSLVRYAAGANVSGWTSLFTAIVFTAAAQLVCLGLLGEYVGRIYAMVQGRPGYIIGYDSAMHQTVPEQDDHRVRIGA
jgi:dolichol-phosphate mannosyltransferase